MNFLESLIDIGKIKMILYYTIALNIFTIILYYNSRCHFILIFNHKTIDLFADFLPADEGESFGISFVSIGHGSILPIIIPSRTY